MINNDATMREKRDVLRNDQRLRDQGSTYMAHTHNDTGVRFSAVSNPKVIGSTPNPAPQYPAGNAWAAGDQGIEPSLGVDINKVERCG